MDTIKKTLLSTLLISSFAVAYADEDNGKLISNLSSENTNLKNEKQQLQITVKEQQQEISNLKKEIDNLNKSIDNLNKSIEKCKRDSSAVITKLKAIKAELPKKEKDKIEKPLLDSIHVIIAANNAQKEREAVIKKQMDSLKTEYDSLSAFKLQYIKQTLEKEKDYPSMAYSSVDMNHVNGVIANCIQLHSPEFAGLQSSFETLKRNKETFDELKELLTIKLSNNEIDQKIVAVNALKESSTSDDQKQEVSRLAGQLKKYKDANTALLVILKENSTFMQKFRTAEFDVNFARIKAESLLSSDRIIYNQDNYFDKIPYIKQRFEEYKAELLAHPKDVPVLEKEYLPNK